MEKFKTYFLMKEADVIEYIKYKLPDYFDKDANLVAKEIGDGNLNYVFRITDKNTDKTIIVKQAGEHLRISDKLSLSTKRGQLEADTLLLYSKLAPSFVPEIYLYDKIMCAISMEDMKEHTIMREALISHKIFPFFANQISNYLAYTLFYTSDLYMLHDSKMRFTSKFVNDELCDLTQHLVFSEPYLDYNNRNNPNKDNLDFFKKEISKDKELLLEVTKYKFDFLCNKQSLIHGDLHTGSIFINENHIFVFDPEFAFFGPSAYDIGNIIANLIFAYFNGAFTIKTKKERTNFTSYILSTISEIINLFKEKFIILYNKNVRDEMAKNDGFINHYINKMIIDTTAYAGIEIIRRVVGMAKVADITSLDKKSRKEAEQKLILIAKNFIIDRHRYNNGETFIETIEYVIRKF